MKLALSGVLSFLLVTAFTCAISGSSFAESLVSISLYRADARAENGYRKAYHWKMNKSDEWRRFDYLANERMSVGEKADVSPFIAKTDKMLVMTTKDDNGITGKDYYLSKNGLMVSEILTKDKYFLDTHQLYPLLQENLKEHTTVETFPGEKIPVNAPGIIVRYLINQDMPNPSWLVNKQKDINFYDSLLRRLKPNEFWQNAKIKDSFEGKKIFVLSLNYPKAPAKYAIIGVEGIRFSDTDSKDSFLNDDDKYFDFFYNLTMENIKGKIEIKDRERERIERGSF